MKRIVKNYEIQHPLGEGGMGTVFYAVEVTLRREVALKCLRPEIANNPGVMDRFRNEAQAQAKLNHPNVAHLWEYFQVGTEHFMAMEYVNGPTLSKVLRDRGRLAYEEAVGYVIQALLGLEHAHRHGIVHRDIKPANLMLTKEGQVKVTDFGIARVSGASRSTRVGMIVGTYEYISPEAAQGLPTTASSDIYSMGVVLFELITGRLPFDNSNEFELLKMHIEASRPSLRSVVKEIPGALDDLVQRSMDRTVRRRFRSAEEMATELQKCLDRTARRTSPTGLSRFWPLAREKAPQLDLGLTDRRRTDISSTCHRIEDLLEQQRWDDAAGAVDAGMRAFPSEPDLIDLSNRLQRQRQLYQQGISQQAELVRDLLDRGLPEAAMKAVGSALATYPSAATLLDLQRECRRRVDLASASAGELAKVQQKIDELVGAGKFQEATDYVLELHGGSLNQNELGKLLARILQARKESEKQEAIRRELAQAADSADQGDWTKALSLLDTALTRFPSEPKIEEFRKQVTERWQADLRRRAVESLLEEARALERAGNLQAARDRVAKDLDSLAQDPALLAELHRFDAALEAARREAAIQLAVSQAESLRDERKWHEALELLQRAVASEGPDARMEELRATVNAELHAHQVLVDRACTEARGFMGQGRWEDAVLRLSTAMRGMTGEKVLTELLQEAQRGLAERRRAETIARIKTEAGEHARERNYQKAIDLLLDAVSQYPEDESLSAVLSQTVFDRDTFVVQEKVRVTTERVAEMRAKGEFERALQLLDDTLRELPNNAELRDKQSELDREWRELRRKTAVRLALAGALESGMALEQDRRWDEAAEVYERTLTGFPETKAELQSRIEHARANAAEARRTARIQELERSVSEWIEAGLLDEADTELKNAEREFPAEAAFVKWRETLTAERHRVARDAAIQTALEAARRSSEFERFEDAERVLQDALREWGADDSLEQALENVQKAHAEQRATIEDAVTKINGLIREHGWDLAISTAISNGERYRGEPRFKTLLADACQARENEKRRLDIERKIADIRALLDAEAFGDADILIRAALREYPSENSFHQLRVAMVQAREAVPLRLAAAEKASRDRAAELERQARVLADAREYDQALALLDKERSGASELLARLLDEARGRLASEKHAWKLHEAERPIRGLLANMEFEKALAAVDAAAIEHPGEKVWSDLRRLATKGIEEQAAVKAKVAEIEALAASGQGVEADRVLVEALRRFPGWPEFIALRTRVDAVRAAEWERKAREAGLQRAVVEIEQRLAKSELDQALAALAKLESQFGAAPEIAAKVATALAERDRQAELRRAQEEKRRVEEAERQRAEAEARRIAEEKRLAEEARERAARLQQQERQRVEAEARRVSEEKRLAEETREQERQRAEAEARRIAEEKRLVDEAERKARAGALEKQIRGAIDSGRLEEAVNLSTNASTEFPEIAAFRSLREDANKRIAAGKKARRLAELESGIRSSLEQQDLPKSLAQVDAALAEFPGEKALVDLRASIVAAREIAKNVAALTSEIQRLVNAGSVADADRKLVEALRRYPDRPELTKLREPLEVARAAEWEKKSREAALRQGVTALQALEAQYGAGSAPDVAKRVAAKVEAREQQIRQAETAVVETPPPAPAEPRPTVLATREAPTPVPMPQPAVDVPGPAPTPVAAGGGRKIWIVAAAVVVLIAGGAAVKLMNAPRDTHPIVVPSPPETAPQPVIPATVLHPSRASIAIKYQVGHPLPPSESIEVTPDVAIAVEVTKGGQWLTARADPGGKGKVVVSVRFESLKVGSHEGAVRIAPADGKGDAVTVPVTLAFLPPRPNPE